MSVNYQNICAALYRETHLLDDQQWDVWLECYAEGITYWMLTWDDDDQLTGDPRSQILLMCYANRYGLENRVFHIKIERNGASTPEPRTSHTVISVEVLIGRGNEVDVHYNFHMLNHRYRTTDHFFGTIFIALRRTGDDLLTASKKIVLKNNYVRRVLDVYHI